METSQTSLVEAFAELTDPHGRECGRKLKDLLLVAICAVMSGAESWIPGIGVGDGSSWTG